MEETRREFRVIREVFSRRQRVEIDSCFNCGVCTSICPIQTVTHERELIPPVKLSKLRTFLYTRTIAENELKSSVEAFFKCSGCALCTEVCPVGINTRELWEKARSVFVKLGYIHDKHRERADFVKYFHNFFGEQTQERDKWLPEYLKDTFISRGKVAFFVGCTIAYRDNSIALSIAKILKKLNVKLVLLGNEEYCCGSPMIRIGQLEIAKGEIAHNVRLMKNLGIEQIIVACPGCYSTIRFDWRRVYGDIPFEVIHIVEFLEYLISRGRLKLRKGLREAVTYHDPCHLGRYCGIYNEPRVIIQSIPNVCFVEMKRSKLRSRCCGAGGGVGPAFPNLAIEMGKRRIEDALEVGANKIITACPACKLHMNYVSRKFFENKVKVIYITELLVDLL